MLDVVQGCLVYPLCGIHIGPDATEYIAAIFYGGQRLVSFLPTFVTFVLSLSMRRGAYGAPIADLGFGAALCDVIGAYP